MKHSIKYLVWIIIIIIILWIFLMNNNENFNEQTGQFCNDCKDKTFNSCLQCFNCGFCVDVFGNSQCIGGDVNGPYNNEKCYLWYTNEVWPRMKEMNDNYKCSYGPTQANRII